MWCSKSLLLAGALAGITSLSVLAQQANTDRMSILEMSEEQKALLQKYAEEGAVQYDAKKAQDVLSGEDRAVFQKQRELLREALSKRSGKWFDGVNINPTEQQDNPYFKAAESAVRLSQSRLPSAIADLSGISQQEAATFNGDAGAGDSAVIPGGKAIFASFSMNDTELKSVLEQASKEDAQVFFKGLKRGHKDIMQTMNEMRRIGSDLEKPPYTRFHPEAFEVYGVTQVPTVIYFSDKKVVLASGTTSFDWLEERAEELEDGLTNLGVQGPVRHVEEKSLLLEIQERLSNIDWEAKKKAAIDNFWRKKEFHHLPKAQEDDEWFIDPTIKVTKDIVNPRGDQLAYEGQVLNPLNHATTNLVIYAFDAKDMDQLNWVLKKLKEPQPGQVMLMTSRLDKERGWEHLDAIRGTFKQDVYLLPEEIVSKFQLSALPARISTDLEKGLLQVKQFKL